MGRRSTLLVALLCGALPLSSITQIDYNTQIRNKPIISGPTVPGSCTIAGNFFFATNLNLLYVCDGSAYQAISGTLVTSGSTTPSSCSTVPALFFNTTLKVLFVCDETAFGPASGPVPNSSQDLSLFIATACSSIKEAAIPAGTYTAQTTVTPTAGCFVHGVGRGGGNNGPVVVNFIPTNTTFLNVTQDNVHIQGLTILQVGTATTGSVGIFQAGNGSGIVGAHGDWGQVQDVNIRGFRNGIKLMGSGGSFDLTNVQVDASRSDGITALGSQGYWDRVIVTGNIGNGITIGLACCSGGIGPFMTNIQTFGNGGWGLLSTSQIYLSGGNSYFNNDFLGEISLTSVPPQAYSGYIKDADVQFAGQSVSFGTNTSAPGIFLGSGAIATVDNIHFFGNQGNGMTIIGAGSGNLLSHLYSVGSGAGGTAFRYALQVTSGNTTVTDSKFGNIVALGGNNNIFRGNTIAVGEALPALLMGPGLNYFVDGNIVSNGTGNSIQIEVGATANHGYNILTGTFLNAGTVSANEVQMFP